MKVAAAKLVKQYDSIHLPDEVPSITKQTKWPVKFTSFGRAEAPNIRYFNTTIINRDDAEWMVARKSEGFDLTRMGENSLVAFKLDDNRNPIAFTPIQLQTTSYKDQHFEDPRITWIGGEMFLSYCTFQIFNRDFYSGAHQQACKLDANFVPQSRWDPIYGHNGGSILTGTGNEKNWVFFEHDSTIHTVYNTEPHTVVRWYGENVSEIHETSVPEWEFGHKRGGTPPVRIGDEYLCFFHSSTMWTEKKRRYHMGAYTFQAKPPFRVTRTTIHPILSGSKNDPWREGLPLVVFPCGAILKNNKWVVTMGVNDFCTAWIEIPHRELEKHLHPVTHE